VDSFHEAKFQSPYHASGAIAPKFSFSKNNLHLTCQGFLIDKIDGLAARGDGYFDWLEGSVIQPDSRKTAYGDDGGIAISLYRTLVLDRVAYGKRASDRHAAILRLPSTFKAASPQFKKLGWKWLSEQRPYYFRWEEWRYANRNFRLGNKRLGDYFTDETPSDASEYDYSEVYCCFDRTCKARRLMTTSNGYLGWARDNIYGSNQDQVRKGDLIAIIFGCSMPTVIHPIGDCFQVLAEAYIQDLMEGEALSFLESEICQVQEFTFC